MKKLSNHIIDSGPNEVVPEWRAALDSQMIDSVHMRLIDECLREGFPLAAQNLAKYAVYESATALPPIVEERK